MTMMQLSKLLSNHHWI